MNQMGLFDATAGAPKRDIHDESLAGMARDLGILRVEQATPNWQTLAVTEIQKLATMRAEFSTDDVWRGLGRDGVAEGRAMGAAMVTAVKKGYIERTDRTTKSARVACHRRDVRIWRSLLFRP